ncbi:hypothetical protein K435DRAFT_942554 [Dendrothele bispora CBS 962.96]|uniref:Uncharacterized protein n=1 Tax=Dendrothele bispora (strain CBS 962.96) TaxID=1314807 RepID=A0A4S8KV62_DENBC|nr:hypothetical protein K435DRAFT_942554 [Dendrothele bispora CBS 962.96]
MSVIASDTIEQTTADGFTSDYTSLLSSGTFPKTLFSFWIPAILILLYNVFLKCEEEWGTSRSIALWEIKRDVLELKLKCSNIKISSYSRHDEPLRSIIIRIKSRGKLLTEIIKCYEDARIVKRSIEEAIEHRKQLQYNYEILCHDNAFHKNKKNDVISLSGEPREINNISKAGPKLLALVKRHIGLEEAKSDCQKK